MKISTGLTGKNDVDFLITNIYNKKQGKNQTERAAHPTSTAGDKESARFEQGEQWISFNGTTAYLNIKLQNGDIYHCSLSKVV